VTKSCSTFGYKDRRASSLPPWSSPSRHDVDPNEGRFPSAMRVEALVLHPRRTKEGRPDPVPRKRATVRARAWGTIEELKEKGRGPSRATVIEVVKGAA